MPIPIFMYHQIDALAPFGSPYRDLTVRPQDFAWQMAWLKRLGFKGLSMRDLLPYLTGRKSGRVAGITFDDGFRNVHRHALPILQTFGFTATNYFVSNQIGGFNQWDVNTGVPYAACMSRSDVLEWAAAGHEVGAHTLDHARLAETPLDEARRQIIDSRHALEDMTGQAVDAFCYPHGSFSQRVRTLVEEAGFSTATTIEKRRVTARDNLLLLPRKTVRGSDGLYNFLRKSLVK